MSVILKKPLVKDLFGLHPLMLGAPVGRSQDLADQVMAKLACVAGRSGEREYYE